MSGLNFTIKEEPKLSLHRTCKKMIGRKIPAPDQVKIMDESPLMTNLVSRISARTGASLTLKDVILIYRACSYEHPEKLVHLRSDALMCSI